MTLTLTCQQARALVSEYINGDLDTELGRALEQHLQTCATCPPLYASLVALRRTLRQSPLTGLSPAARGRIARSMRQIIAETS